MLQWAVVRSAILKQLKGGLFTRLARISLYVVAIVFLGLGMMSLIAPTNLTPLVEVAMPTPVAVMEIRGVYGGFFCGTGLFLLLFARRDSWLRPGLVAQASIFGGFVLGRTLGIMIGGAPNLFISALLAGEIVGLAAALILLHAPVGELSTQAGNRIAS